MRLAAQSRTFSSSRANRSAASGLPAANTGAPPPVTSSLRAVTTAMILPIASVASLLSFPVGPDGVADGRFQQGHIPDRVQRLVPVLFPGQRKDAHPARR